MSSSQPITRALVVADGDVPLATEIGALLAEPPDGLLVVAADGGLRRAELLGLRTQLLVGDGDSLAPDVLAGLASRGIETQLHPTDKDASDTELAVLEAASRGASQIIILGALGGLRFEHALANVLLLCHPALRGRDVRLVDGRSTVRALVDGGALAVSAEAGRLVSLLPLSERVSQVRTTGLRFALDGEQLEQGSSRGLSNELIADRGEVAIGAGRLAIIQTHQGGAP